MPLLPVPGTATSTRSMVCEMPLGMDEIYMALSMADIFSLLAHPGMFIRRLVLSMKQNAWRAHRGTES